MKKEMTQEERMILVMKIVDELLDTSYDEYNMIKITMKAWWKETERDMKFIEALFKYTDGKKAKALPLKAGVM